jgi:hypothetical protein
VRGVEGGLCHSAALQLLDDFLKSEFIKFFLVLGGLKVVMVVTVGFLFLNLACLPFLLLLLNELVKLFVSLPIIKTNKLEFLQLPQ